MPVLPYLMPVLPLFRTPMKTIVHVNQHILRKNLKNKENNPVLTVKTHKSNTYAHTVEIQGPSRVVYSPNKPLSCGARVWIETQAEVVLDRPRVTNRHAAEGPRAEDHGPRE